MPPSRSLILCTTPRTGSTLLCALLAASGCAGRPESWYRAEDRTDYESEWGVPEGDSARFLAAAIRAGSDGTGCFGLRIQAASLSPLLAELRGLLGDLPDRTLLQSAFGPCSFIYIRRQDDVAQAVSRLKAEVSQVWHLDGTEPKPRARASYDAGQLDAFRAEAAAGNALWEDWFAQAGIQPERLVYEQLSAAPAAAIRGLLLRLKINVPRDRSLAVPNRRMADEESALWAARYRADRGLPSTEVPDAL